jgi:hypothetical protein
MSLCDNFAMLEEGDTQMPIRSIITGGIFLIVGFLGGFFSPRTRVLGAAPRASRMRRKT